MNEVKRALSNFYCKKVCGDPDFSIITVLVSLVYLKIKRTDMNYSVEILLEQKTLLEEEVRFAEGKELEETKQRYADVCAALNKLNLPDVSRCQPLLANVDLTKAEEYLITPEAQAELNRILNEPIPKWPKPTWEQLNTSTNFK